MLGQAQLACPWAKVKVLDSVFSVVALALAVAGLILMFLATVLAKRRCKPVWLFTFQCRRC
jgi:hypothetical protein